MFDEENSVNPEKTQGIKHQIEYFNDKSLYLYWPLVKHGEENLLRKMISLLQ